MQEGILIRGQGGIYTVRHGNGEEYTLRAKKKFRRQHISPLVGDRILFTPGQGGDEHGWIEEILPRLSSFVRPPAANVSMLVIVAAPEPEPDFLLIDRLLISARTAGIRAAVLLNKKELDPSLETELNVQYQGAGAGIIAVSAKTGEGIPALPDLFRDETVCFCGQSGVGKSTLINALLDIRTETGEISRKISRGKNTTRHVELFFLKSLRLMDTPGFSLLTLSSEKEDPVLLKSRYPEFEPYEGKCRFDPCYHDREPGCSVRQAVADNLINRSRYERYGLLLQEQRENWRKRYD